MDKATFEIGEDVLLNGKFYKIIGTIKRSFLLEKKSNGKQYKATAKMMSKIKDQNKQGIGVGRKKRTTKPDNFYMEKKLAYDKIFNPEAKMPETETELMDALDRLLGELSPENLSCDGEISRTAINKKLVAIRGEWKEIEKKLGRKVPESIVEDYSLAKFEAKNDAWMEEVANSYK